MDIRPFRIEIPDEALADLRDRLRRTRWPGEVAGSGWTYGTNLAYLRDLVDYWIEEYDWRAAEARLNEWPQFIARSPGGFAVHFAHLRGRGPSRLPIVLTHGWPGSFFEFTHVAGPLADPAAHGGSPEDAFDLIIPSLPGYGFSPDPGRAITPLEIADAWADLMTEGLGYPRFGAQGGDWGATVTTALGLRHPDTVIGIHLNMLSARPHTGPDDPPLTDEERAMIDRARVWQAESPTRSIAPPASTTQPAAAPGSFDSAPARR